MTHLQSAHFQTILQHLSSFIPQKGMEEENTRPLSSLQLGWPDALSPPYLAAKIPERSSEREASTSPIVSSKDSSTWACAPSRLDLADESIAAKQNKRMKAERCTIL